MTYETKQEGLILGGYEREEAYEVATKVEKII